MQTTFARVLHLLMTLERSFGLSGLDAEQRAIFDFIVARAAEDKPPSANDIVNAKITSRSSTYRHLSALKDSGMIFDEFIDGAHVMKLMPQFSAFVEKVSDLQVTET